MTAGLGLTIVGVDAITSEHLTQNELSQKSSVRLAHYGGT